MTGSLSEKLGFSRGDLRIKSEIFYIRPPGGARQEARNRDIRDPGLSFKGLGFNVRMGA
jgi:hypothetical protein